MSWNLFQYLSNTLLFSKDLKEQTFGMFVCLLISVTVSSVIFFFHWRLLQCRTLKSTSGKCNRLSLLILNPELNLKCTENTWSAHRHETMMMTEQTCMMTHWGWDPTFGPDYLSHLSFWAINWYQCTAARSVLNIFVLECGRVRVLVLTGLLLLMWVSEVIGEVCFPYQHVTKINPF